MPPTADQPERLHGFDHLGAYAQRVLLLLPDGVERTLVERFPGGRPPLAMVTTDGAVLRLDDHGRVGFAAVYTAASLYLAAVCGLESDP